MQLQKISQNKKYDLLIKSIDEKLKLEDIKSKYLADKIQQLQNQKEKYINRFEQNPYQNNSTLLVDSRIDFKNPSIISSPSPRKTQNSFINSPSKYKKVVDEAKEQLLTLMQKIYKKQKKYNLNEDVIIKNLWKKIDQQEVQIFKQYDIWKVLIAKNRTIKQLNKIIEELHQEIFKREKYKQLKQKAKLNKNKEILKSGYTQKMIKIIQSHI